MESLIKIGDTVLNLDRVCVIDDRFAARKENAVADRFGPLENEVYTFTGREADDLRTWLYSQAVNLQDATNLATEGRGLT
jgi:hypothetical protein